MTLKQDIFLLLAVILLVSSFEFEKTNGIRLCGRRLADLLNLLCEKHGGFHAPRVRRDGLNKTVTKRALIEVFKPVVRRSDSDDIDGAMGSLAEGSFNFSFQKGIVDECCKKQCTLPTLLSYCANVQHAGSIDLNEILPPETESFPSLSDEDMAAYQLRQASSTANPSQSSRGTDKQIIHLPSPFSYTGRPNLGHSARNRPVFIVLSQLQEDDDRALGEYRF